MKLRTREFLPAKGHELLLKACLMDAPKAKAALDEWLGRETGDTFDHASLRLFPLLAARAQDLGLDATLAGLLRKEQRKAWLRNQMHFKVTAEAVGMLERAGIEACMLKGVALASHFYNHPGLRAAADIDLLVRPRDAERAVGLFKDAGWGSKEPWPTSPARYVTSKGFNLFSPAAHKTEIDLHWRLNEWTYCAQAMDALWAKCVPVSVAGREAFSLGPTDMLMHTCSHGAKWSEVAPIRWVADAAMILRKGPIDWDHLLRQSERLSLTLRLRIMLPYLSETFQMDIPAQVLDALAQREISAREELIFTYGARPLNERPFLSRFRIHWQRCRRMLPASPRLLLEYLLIVNRGRGALPTLRWLLRVLRIRAND